MVALYDTSKLYQWIPIMVLNTVELLNLALTSFILQFC